MKGIRSLRSNVKAQTVVYVVKTVNGKKVYIPVAEILPGDRIYTVGVNFGLKKYESLNSLKLSYYRWRTRKVSLSSLDPEVGDYINKTLKGSDASLKNNKKEGKFMSNKTNNNLWVTKQNASNKSIASIINNILKDVKNKVKNVNPLTCDDGKLHKLVREVTDSIKEKYVKKLKKDYWDDVEYHFEFEGVYSCYGIPYFYVKLGDSEGIVYFDAISYNHEKIQNFIQNSKKWKIEEIFIMEDYFGIYLDEIEIAEGDVVSSEKLLSVYTKLKEHYFYPFYHNYFPKDETLDVYPNYGYLSLVKDDEGYKITFERGNPDDSWNHDKHYITITAC